jgi:hypothetical protein
LALRRYTPSSPPSPPPADVAWITAFGAACSTLNTFTFVTTGPTAVYRSITSAMSLDPQLAVVTATATTTTTGAMVVFTTPGPQQTLSTPSPVPQSPSLFLGALAGLIIGLILITALLTLLCVWCVCRARRRRRAGAGAGVGVAAAAVQSEVSDAVPVMMETPS